MKKTLCLLALCFAAQNPALWAIPTEINYQGTLKEKGLPANGTKTITYQLTSQDGNTPYSNVISVAATVVNGLFSSKLDFQLLSGLTWETITPYIKVTVEGQGLSPTEKVSATVYANISSTTIDGAVTPAKVAAGYGLVPSGTIVAFGGTNAPAGWLLCDGSVQNRSTYSNLFSAIGVTWGGGASTFNLPDLRGRTAIGAGQGPGLTNRPLGQTLGEETHTLTSAEMPTHSHTVNDPGHRHYSNILGAVWGVGPSFPQATNGGTTITTPAGYTSADTTGITIQPNGGGAAHNIMQPYSAINYIIKT